MRRVLVPLVIIIVMLIMPIAVDDTPRINHSDVPLDIPLQGNAVLSSAEGGGVDRSATAFMSRTLTAQQLSVLNSYASPNSHTAQLDLSSYQIPGWSLYNVTLTTESMIAAPERESLGVTQNNNIAIENSSGTIFDGLYQEFYDLPHDGKLENYTITCRVLYYWSGFGHAYLGVRSNFTDSQTNSTGWITPWVQNPIADVDITHDTSGDSAILNASTPYYVTIDGSTLTGISDVVFNTIQWKARTILGLETGYSIRGDKWYIYEGAFPREATLEYTYTPWNKTANSAMEYAEAEDVSLTGNSSGLSGMSWVFTSQDSITSISFESNQSADISYNMTLSYKKDITATTTWGVSSSGSDVEWNATTTLSYPSISEKMYLNVSVPSAWTTTGLYNSTSPSVNYGNFLNYGTTVFCSQLTNGTWTLRHTSYNHLNEIGTFDSLDDSIITLNTSIAVDIDINSSVKESDNDPVSTGTTNLTILYGGTTIWAPSNQTVIIGKTHYLWDISTTTSFNGLYNLEMRWENGTEAGYLTKEIIVVYPTVLTPSETVINAYTENSFEIRAYFGDTFTPQGLNGTYSLAEYSFDGASNVSMIDLDNGTWTADVPTIGKNPGTYEVSIFAEGFALVNQSTTISVTLIHETQPLTLLWSNGDNITFVEQTELSIVYRRVDGVNVTSAQVNVTIDGTTLPLSWHAASETYRIMFNGTDEPPGFGTFGLNIQAWKTGHLAQSNNSQSLTLREEPTSIVIEWSNTNDITYIESTMLSVNFTMSNGSAVTDAEVNVTINANPWILSWNGISKLYEIQFNGTDSIPGFGVHSLTISARKFGYQNWSDTTQTLTLSKEPTTLEILWDNGNNITFVQSTVLIANYTMSNGSAVLSATVNVTIDFKPWVLVWDGLTETYRITFNGSDTPPGFGTHNMIIRSEQTGYEGRLNSTWNITLREEPTNILITWSNSNNITYAEHTVLSINYTMSNGTVISGSAVNATIDSKTWILAWDVISETYRITFNGSDVPPGFGTHTLTIIVWKYGYQAQSDSVQQLTLRIQPTAFQVSWSNTDTISYVNHTVLSVNYTMTNGTAVQGATVNVTIEDDFWILDWNGTTETYQYRFNGDDEPPGLGVHVTIIEAVRTGYEIQLDNTQTLTIQKEFTSLFSLWNPDNNVTYIEFTTLSVNYWMNNGTAIPGATVNVTIGPYNWSMLWNAGDKNYQIQFNGSDNPPGFALHSLFIEAWKKGYIARNISSQTLTLRIDPTDTILQWSNGNSIGYFDHTVLTLDYRMSSGTTIVGAFVNVTIGGTVWPMDWNSTSGLYEVRFNGSDNPPGIGIHSLTIQAWKYGFEEQTDTSQTLTLPVVPTIIQVQWSNGDNITTVENTILSVNYTMYNGTIIPGAEANATIGLDTWTLTWNSSTRIYEVMFNGTDNPPGYGTHSISIQAWKVDFADQSDNSQELTLREEPTSMQILWSNGNNITFVEQTTLRVRYLMSNGSAIQGAIVQVTIGVTVSTADWQAGSQEYQLVFRGRDDPPGFGVHSLLVQAFALGFVYASNNTETLTLTEEPTNIQYTWSLPKLNNISYLEYTTLSVTFEESDGTPIPDAVLNVTIGSTTLHMAWNGASESYEVQFYGNEDPPDFGTYSITLKASKFGFVSVVDTTEELTIRVEDASLAFAWSNTNTISFVEDSTISFAYLLRNGSPIIGATVNVTIGIDVWTATWNVSDGTYYVTFNGTDDPPGFGNHSLTISAWKLNYQGQVNSSSLIINKENTSVSFAWSNGNDITYVQFTTLNVTYAMNNGTSIPGATVNVTIGSDTWTLQWDGPGEVYRIQFNGSDSIPGNGTHGLTVRAEKFGYEGRTNSSQILTITGELGEINSEWITTGNITFVEFTILQVNYTMSNGTAIPSATVNVTISVTTWDLIWHPASETYRVIFYGDDNPPGIGTHSPEIKAWRYGFDYVRYTSMTLEIRKEPTSLLPTWYASKQDNISYFDHTYLFVDYLMSNGTMILDATVNVAIDSDIWSLEWNATEGAYAIRFNGSDLPPGMGIHDLVIQASIFGYSNATDNSQTLTLRPDPTTVEVTWLTGNDITFIENTTLLVKYRMSNGSEITGAQLNVSISSDYWFLIWTSTANAYSVIFSGIDDPPGLGIHSLTILASKTFFADQIAISSLTIKTDPTTLQPSWFTESIDWTQTVNFSVDYRDSEGTLIAGATQLLVSINGTQYALQGTNGTYWIEFDNAFGLGYHSIDVNVSKFGYDYAYIASIHFNITIASTFLDVELNTPTIDYLGQIDITTNYTYLWDGSTVPMLATFANVSVDGAEPIGLNQSGYLWTANLTGLFLDLGPHNLIISAWAYGYKSLEQLVVVNVNNVSTNPLDITWEPTNVTIEYIDSFNLTVDYTFYGGDVPVAAIVNVTIASQTYNMTYSAGAWRVSIPGASIGLGIHQAQISAWLYGFSVGTNTTNGLNVTLGANSFIVIWEPILLTVSYVDHINISVIYTHDFNPILDAIVKLTLNGTITYDLEYEPIDEKWHLMLNASDIGLGVWNATVSANKTGYAPGVFWDIIQVNRDDVSAVSSWMVFDTDYVTSVPLSLNLSSSDDEYTIGSNVTIEILGVFIPSINHGNGTYSATLGPLLNIGIHTVNVTFSGFWFNTVSVFLTLNVSQTDTVPLDSVTFISNSVIYYDETTLIEFSYQMLNGSIVPGGSSLVYVNGIEEIAGWNIDQWELILSGSSLGLGLHDVMINASAYGYTSTTYEFQITVKSIPTLLEIHGRYWLYVNDTSYISITFRDNRTNDPIVADSAIITWASTFNLNSLGNNTYELVIQSTGLHVGLETLEFEFMKNGYDYASGQQSIELRLLPVNLIFDSIASQYENETVTITAQLIDTVHSAYIHWADISLLLDESEYNMEYDSEQQEYIAQIYLGPSITPGDYIITLSALATDCVPSSDNITLTVMAKSSFDLNIEVPNKARVGETLVVSISLTEQSQPVVGITVMIQITWTMIDDTIDNVEEIVTTNSSGQVELTIDVPARAIEARIQAHYLGSIDSWPAVTEEEVIAIESGGSDPLSIIIGLLKDPVILTLVVGTPAMSIAGLALLRRRRRSLKPPLSTIPELDALSTGILEKAERFSISQIDPESPIFYRMEDGGTLILSEVNNSLQETLNEVGLNLIDYTTFLAKMGIIAGIGVLGKAAISSPKTDISQYLMEQIKTSVISNDVGLTRRELAEHLGISISNIGKIVKELIELDIGFYEVREGGRRLIKHSDSAYFS